MSHPLDILGLYQKYDAELRALASRLRVLYHAMQRQGYHTAFSDVEGEILYMLVRERRPEVAFEISPCAGWSTNYLLAGLTANGTGVLHSFELSPIINRRATEDVIRGNQLPESDQRRLVIHIGDATQTAESVPGTIDLLLLDSCHEAWFAKWYIDTLLPRVQGPVMVQDIAFTDRLESSSEASYVWSWILASRLEVALVGRIERELASAGIRQGFPERNGFRSNTIILTLPPHVPGGGLHLEESLERLVERAWEASAVSPGDADRLLNEVASRLLDSPPRSDRHRLLCEVGACYLHLGDRQDAQRCFERALGTVLLADVSIRVKGLLELLEFCARHRQWRLAAQVLAMMSLEPKSWRGAARFGLRAVRALVRWALRRREQVSEVTTVP